MLITFSGIDGSGKSTQLGRLEGALNERGMRCRTVWYRPGYSDALKSARSLVRRLRPSALPTAGDRTERATRMRRRGVSEAWVAMAAIDAVAQYAVKLRYLLSKNDVVICDRFVDDSILDLRLNFPGVPLGPLPTVLARTSPRPDLSLMLMLPWELAIARLAGKDDPFPDEESLRRVRYDHYVELASSGAFTVIDAAGTQDEVGRIIIGLVDHLLETAQG